jgi:predicted aconitase with swiveling domain
MIVQGAKWTGRGIVKGTARGPALLSKTSFSFLGDVDIRTGRVVGVSNDIHGRSIARAVLVVPATRGSAGAWRFLYQLKVHNTHPVAIVTEDLPDPSVVQGAILAKIPIVAGVAEKLLLDLADGVQIAVDGTEGCVFRVS